MATNSRAKSEKYWLERIREDEKFARENVEKASERIQKLYEAQYKKVAKQMELLYAQVQDGKAPGRTALWNYSRWREMELSMSGFVKGGSVIEREQVMGCLDRVFAEVIGKPVGELNTSMFTVKIKPSTVIDTAWSGERFSTRIWKNRAALADRIRLDMEDMIVQGRGLSDMRRELMREFSVSYRQADTLLRTETNYVMNKAHLQRYKESGTTKVRWRAKNRQEKQCQICGGRDGKVFWIDNAPTMPAHPRCGCRYTGVVELEGEDVPVDGPEALEKER